MINCPFYGYHWAAPRLAEIVKRDDLLQPGTGESLHYAPIPPPRIEPPRGAPFMLLASRGNQCAIVLDSFSPCLFAAEPQYGDWRECPRLAELRTNL